MTGHVEDVFLETVTVTGFTLQNKVGHELHLHRDDTGTLTLLTASALCVEREILGREAHLLGQRLVGIEVTDGVVGLDVSGRIGTGGLADGILVDELHVFHGVDVTTDAEIFTRQVTDLTEMTLQGRVEDTLDKTGLPRARHASDDGHHIQRNLHVNAPQVIHPCPLDVDMTVPWPTCLRYRDLLLMHQILYSMAPRVFLGVKETRRQGVQDIT